MREENQALLHGTVSFENILHRSSASTGQGIGAMMQKNREAQKAAVADYFQHWDGKDIKEETAETRAARAAEYDSLTRQYYNLVTDFYEFGWSQSFHFCRFGAREAFQQAIARHEHYLAHTMGIDKGMAVLDVGCGVGGPAREIAKFTGCNVTGLNINEYQIQRATRYAQQQGIAEQLQFIQGDFMKMPFADATFDAVYAIEATVHAPSLLGVYSEIYRVLKPGGTFGVYEWVMTEVYDNDSLEHRQLRFDIEQGDGISNIVKGSDALAAIKGAGFELLQCEDMAERHDPSPWYWPLDGDGWRNAQSISDFAMTFRMSRWGRFLTHNFMAVLETLRLAPPGTKKTGDSLVKASDALVQGGKLKLFTPMFLMVGKKRST